MSIDVHWVQVGYELWVHGTEDRNGDEPRLQFAFIAIEGTTARVEVVDSGRLGTGVPARTKIRGTVVLPHPVPSPANPFLGLVVRAIEDDNSSASNRAADRAVLAEAIRASVQRRLDTHGNPDTNETWAAANGAPIIDRRWRDDDDKIGVSIRFYPKLGAELAAAARARQEPVDPGIHITRGFTEAFTLRFFEDGANYELNGRILGATFT